MMKLTKFLQKYADFLEGLRLNLFGGSLQETVSYLKQHNKSRP